MLPTGIKEKFELYRKWLGTLLIQEFLNLPSAHQERFIKLIEKFVEDCKKIYVEGKIIKEKTIELTIISLDHVFNKDEKFIAYCTSPKVKEKIRIPIYKTGVSIGTKLYHTVFSLDGKVWYSSKKELITKGA